MIVVLLKDMMSKDVPSLFKGDSITRAVALFRQSRVDLLPVIDKDMKLVGVFYQEKFP